jgi:hypothetical protein
VNCFAACRQLQLEDFAVTTSITATPSTHTSTHTSTDMCLLFTAGTHLKALGWRPVDSAAPGMNRSGLYLLGSPNLPPHCRNGTQQQQQQQQTHAQIGMRQCHTGSACWGHQTCRPTVENNTRADTCKAFETRQYQAVCRLCEETSDVGAVWLVPGPGSQPNPHSDKAAHGAALTRVLVQKQINTCLQGPC